MNRLPGIDLARGFAFLGMVIVNYWVVLAWPTMDSRDWWLPSFMSRFVSRAAPLFVLIAGVGTTLLYRSARRRRAAGARTTPSFALLRAAALGLVLGLLALAIGYNRWTAAERHPTLKPETVVTGWIADDLRVTAQLPERLGDYFDALRAGDVDLMPWLLGTLGIALALIVVLRNDPRGSLLARAAFLAAVGYAWFPIWEGDILHWYALFLITGAVLVAAPWWIVAPAGLLSLVVAPYWQLVEGWDPRAGWRFFQVPGFWELEDQARNLFYNGWHAYFPWVAFYIAGLLIGRLRLERVGVQVAMLLAGLALWMGATDLMPALRHAFEDEARDELMATTLTIGRELPDGLEIVHGPPIGRPFHDEDSPPASGPKVTSSLAEGLDPETHAGLVRSAKRLARGLSNVKGRPPYARWHVSVEPHPLSDSEGVGVVLEVDYGEGAAVPADHAEHLRHVVSIIAHLMRDDDPFEVRAARRLMRWPTGLDELAIRRTLTMADRTGAGERPVEVDTTFVFRDKVRALDDTASTLAAMVGESSGPPPSLLFFPIALGSSLMALAACLLAARVGFLRTVLHPVTCAGQMALTLYVAHVAIGMTLIKSLGYADDLRTDLVGVAACIVVCWLISLGFAMWWRSFARRGPLEAIMRAVCG